MWKDPVQMELRDDFAHEGKYILRAEEFSQNWSRYPWDYWIGLTLYTGQYLYLKEGVDFKVNPRSFRQAVRAISVSKGLKFKVSWKGLRDDEVKVVWFPPAKSPWEGVDVSQDMAHVEIPDILKDPDYM